MPSAQPTLPAAPAIVVTFQFVTPLTTVGVILRIVLFIVSVTYRLPVPSTAMPCGE